MPLKILGSRVDALSSRDALHHISQYLQSSAPHHIITGNTLMLLAAQEDPELRNILQNAALVTPESSGLLWASRVLGSPLQEFTPGIDLMLAICRIAEEGGHSVFLLGGGPGVAQNAANELWKRFPALKIAGSCHGFFRRGSLKSTASLTPTLPQRRGTGALMGIAEAPVSLQGRGQGRPEGEPRVRDGLPHDEKNVLLRIQQARPSILFVGMGMPAQEKWIARNLAALGVPVVMGVGGSFDVLSGKLRRAPTWMRHAGIEWLYRLTQEPWRWRRIAQLPVFAWKVMHEKIKNQKSSTTAKP